MTQRSKKSKVTHEDDFKEGSIYIILPTKAMVQTREKRIKQKQIPCQKLNKQGRIKINKEESR